MFTTENVLAGTMFAKLSDALPFIGFGASQVPHRCLSDNQSATRGASLGASLAQEVPHWDYLFMNV